jgi:thioredoxin-like negative regulator of GroEL
MMTSLILLVALGVGGQASRPAPPPVPSTSPQELAALVERVVRLADLQRRKLDLEEELAGKALGEGHPEVIALRAALADVAAAIQREGLQSYRAEAYLLAERRVQLENQLARMQVGPGHPDYRSTAMKVTAIREQQRAAAVKALAGGLEAQLRVEIARHPDDVPPYLSLAELFTHAGRPEEAATLLGQAQAALKRAGGR